MGKFSLIYQLRAAETVNRSKKERLTEYFNVSDIEV